MSEVLVQNAGEMWKCVWFALNSTLIRAEHIVTFRHLTGQLELIAGYIVLPVTDRYRWHCLNPFLVIIPSLNRSQYK